MKWPGSPKASPSPLLVSSRSTALMLGDGSSSASDEWNWQRRFWPCFYQARDVIGEIRNPGGFASEGTTRNPSPGEKPEHKEGLARAFVLIERYQRHSELFAATYVALSIHGATWEGCRKAVRRTQQGDQRASIGRIHDVHLCHS